MVGASIRKARRRSTYSRSCSRVSCVFKGNRCEEAPSNVDPKESTLPFAEIAINLCLQFLNVKKTSKPATQGVSEWKVNKLDGQFESLGRNKSCYEIRTTTKE